ncbi:hypothetical protein Q8A73_004775 [Channa argus]|nr:hypothetical protein Q8A73_004775 [Channa argus]
MDGTSQLQPSPAAGVGSGEEMQGNEVESSPDTPTPVHLLSLHLDCNGWLTLSLSSWRMGNLQDLLGENEQSCGTAECCQSGVTHCTNMLTNCMAVPEGT